MASSGEGLWEHWLLSLVVGACGMACIRHPREQSALATPYSCVLSRMSNRFQNLPKQQQQMGTKHSNALAHGGQPEAHEG